MFIIICKFDLMNEGFGVVLCVVFVFEVSEDEVIE